MTAPVRPTTLRQRVHEIIFEADTPAGRAFDVVLIAVILLSVVAVMLESVQSIARTHTRLFRSVEWAVTGMFTVEYVLRLWSTRRPWHYATSFFGVIDLLAVLPTYLDLFLPGSRYLLVIRVLRVVRVFRVFKLVQYVGEASLLLGAVRASLRKITVFLFVVISAVVFLGSLMYVVEGGASGFTSIPKSIYWAIVTLTTVGYGDISPRTPLGQGLAAVIMIFGYSLIAVPTGIVSVEIGQAVRKGITTQVCQECTRAGHDQDAVHCKFCGARL